MSTKTIAVDQAAWALPDDHSETLLKDVESALADGTVLRLDVLDQAGGRVSLFLNGRTARTVVVDLGEGGRPTEISGGQRTEIPGGKRV
jgi:hypothetical protein